MIQDSPLNWMLPSVEKPGRYIGGEWNTVSKDPAGVDLRLCLVFPDLYELGLGNLGLQVLYTALNRLDGVWAERAYLPGPDMEALMRRHGQPLFMLESQEPVSRAHGIRFTLQSELTYVNVLKVLELAGIPLNAAEREDGVPLVFAGLARNRALAPFIDFFVIGDGEGSRRDRQCLRRHRGQSRRPCSKHLPGSRHLCAGPVPVKEYDDGRILPTRPRSHTLAARQNLDAAPFPTVTSPYVNSSTTAQASRCCAGAPTAAGSARRAC